MIPIASASSGVPALGLAKWDGSSWSEVGGGPGLVYELAVYDDGSGPSLFFAAQGSPVGVSDLARATDDSS